MSSSLRKNIVRFSPIATIVALSFACGSESGPSDGAGGSQGPTGGSSMTGGSSNSGGNGNPSGGSANPSGGAGNPSGGNPGSGGGAPDAGGSPSTGGESGGDTGGAPGTGGGGNETGADCSAKEGEVPLLKLTQVVGNLDGPVFTTHPPGDDRLFVITLTGKVLVVKNGAATTFLDISSKVAVGGAGGDERGLLGLAFHPDYATNGFFYLHYSDKNDPNDTGDSIIEEYKVGADPDVADPASARLVLKVEQPLHNPSVFKNHKGGALAFGADKMLYIGLGDGGGSNDPQGNGQSLTALLGKILRINPVKEGDSAYTIPTGNLKDAMSSASPEIWDYGLRNPFRFTFDMCTGDFYIGDVGQNQWEEIDIEKAGDGHQNYGWNRMEGLHCFNPSSPDTSPADCDKSGITLPYIEVPDEQGTSITGGAVYRGSSIPGLRGAYFYADYVSKRAWYTFFDRDAETVSNPVSVTQELNPTSVVAITNGNDGELYFTSLGPISANSVGPGAIYKLEAAE